MWKSARIVWAVIWWTALPALSQPAGTIPKDSVLAPSARLYPVPSTGFGPVLQVRGDDKKFGADVTIAYEAQGLRLGVKILDPTPGPSTAGEGMWQQDCIQVAIDTDPSTRKTGYTGSCFEIGFALLSSGQVAQFAWHSGGGPFDYEGVRAVGRPEADGYRLDIVIGWSSLGLDSRRVPSSLGINLVVSDGGGAKRRYLEWTPGMAKSKSPDEFARLVQIAADAASIADLRVDQPSYASEDVVTVRFAEDGSERKLMLDYAPLEKLA